jgi:hypothetical protein
VGELVRTGDPAALGGRQGGAMDEGSGGGVESVWSEFELWEYPVPEVEAGAILIRLTRVADAFRQADWLSHGGDPLRISRAAIAC